MHHLWNSALFERIKIEIIYNFLKVGKYYELKTRFWNYISIAFYLTKKCHFHFFKFLCNIALLFSCYCFLGSLVRFKGYSLSIFPSILAGGLPPLHIFARFRRLDVTAPPLAHFMLGVVHESQVETASLQVRSTQQSRSQYFPMWDINRMEKKFSLFVWPPGIWVAWASVSPYHPPCSSSQRRGGLFLNFDWLRLIVEGLLLLWHWYNWIQPECSRSVC